MWFDQDPGISNKKSSSPYPPYDLGTKMDIWIKDSKGKPLIGRVEICNSLINIIRDTEFVDCFRKDSSNRFSMKLAGAPRYITMYNAILFRFGQEM